MDPQFKLQLIYHHGLLSRTFVLRVLLLSAAVAVLPFLGRDPDSPSDPDAGSRCDSSSPSVSPAALDSTLTNLLAAGYLPLDGRSLCLGPGAAAASAAMKRLGFPPDRVVVAAPGDACGGARLPFPDASFDFVLSAGGIDRARAPARAALEMERVLAPGRAGAVLAARPPHRPRSLVRTAAAVASMLRASDVMAVRTAKNASAVVVVFRKKTPPAAAW
uniref:Ubiquinone/menaquinone biosynthesis methyltransferase ubiE n=1 Tax=Anthurium amnicola TaxID=1678845 RepID=A0A1D1YVB6_9ARAE